MSAKKERPILFNGAMVRAILDGRKTVTRRLVKGGQIPTLDPSATVAGMRWSAIGQRHPRYGYCVFGETEEACALELGEHGVSPFGQPGDRLWVRETFALLGNEDGVGIDWNDNMVRGDERNAARIYRASCPVGDYGLRQIPDKAYWKPDTDDMQYEGTWRPSIHMPRWASRIQLEITAVRVERLQDITYEQAAAEGIHRHNRMWSATDEGGACHKYPEAAFRDLWLTTGGNWDANPWVWVVEFERVVPANGM
jgi:hypothetical protein